MSETQDGSSPVTGRGCQIKRETGVITAERVGGMQPSGTMCHSTCIQDTALFTAATMAMACYWTHSTAHRDTLSKEVDMSPVQMGDSQYNKDVNSK